MREKVVSGVLTKSGKKVFLKGKGKNHFEGELIWSGYQDHWLGRKLKGRHLPQPDYERGKPIVILWPDEESDDSSVDLIYNERLTHYWESRMGHVAINVGGDIFNFSNLINENEIITPEEYYYRPALGEFAPFPVRGKLGVDEHNRPYYDKFGRIFMRTIQVLRLFDLDLDKLRKHLHGVLDMIHSSKRNPKQPDNYAQFNPFKRSCATFIRDAMRVSGMPEVSGIMPRDLFVNAAYNATVKRSMKARLFKMNQLKVPEAPVSEPSPFSNPMNALRSGSLRWD